MTSNSHLKRMTRLIFAMGLALAARATAQTTAQTTAIATFFLPDSEPLSLDASVVAVNTPDTDDPVTTLQIACPTAASPENDACRAAGIYPAQVYHTRGSVWGGTTTYARDDSTTTWRCALGDAARGGGSGGGGGVTAACSKTIVVGGGGSGGRATTRTESAAYDNCYVVAHRLPLVVTAGADKLVEGRGGGATVAADASELNAEYSSELAAAGCPASETTMFAGAVAVGATTSPSRASETEKSAEAVSSSGPGGPAETSAATQTAPQGAATSATTAPGKGARGKRPMAALWLGVGVMSMLGLMVL
ncbi:hypothetical protein VTK56DRAFT_5542 [Thermocarpiscus australiensis]